MAGVPHASAGNADVVEQEGRDLAEAIARGTAFHNPRFAARFSVLSRMSSRFRARRAARMIRLLAITEETRVLDLGGAPYFWKYFPVRCRVTCLNVRPMTSDDPRVGVETFDGGALPYTDGSFDVVHSNSVIEHVGDFNTQKRFALEIARVGRRYWVQTPAFFFPYEVHAHLPFFQMLPANFKLAILRHWTHAGPGIDDMLSVRLLTGAEMRYLFPGARLWRERFLGLTKSFIAYR